jgi:hypothetical protein
MHLTNPTPQKKNYRGPPKTGLEWVFLILVLLLCLLGGLLVNNIASLMITVEGLML